ncbi:MAG: hypothetical protein KatS3mg031_1319 [Chitinophagales bacterium]|nr:MAG: hypothetical protein KatS3mg031_1319 [Chitinophagales bacterium]
MKKLNLPFIFSAIILIVSAEAYAQAGGGGLRNEYPVTTSVPFLRIPPDARSGGMGDVGLATSADANAMFHNQAKLAFAHKPLGFSINFVPWLRALVNDIYLGQITGYFKPDELQAVGLSMRYFSLGEIQFTNLQGENTGQFTPHEFTVEAAYARQLVKIKKGGGFGASLGLRFIYSNLAAGQEVSSGVVVEPGMTGAADVGFAYNQDFKVGRFKTNLALGLTFTNIGGKITYTQSSEKDFIPMNFGLGFRYEFNIDDHNQINIAADVNKLLVPTPDTTDADGNGILDYREVSVASAFFTSWADAPGGAAEEFREVMWSTGLEYWYNQMFAVRAGYFHENKTKGNRHFFTAGLGLRFSVFGIDFSYLIPTSSQRQPLDNTMRFSLLFQFDNIKRKPEAQPTSSP